MQNKATGAKHGIVRCVDTAEGTLIEATWNHGKRHGLLRKIADGEVFIRLYRMDQMLACFMFDAYFQEVGRNDPQYLLGDLKPNSFE